MNSFDAKECISDIWDQINKSGLMSGGNNSVHSLLADQNGKKIFEEYTYPYSKSKMHRMFSITKSFVSLAIGFLIDEGKLDLSDKITDFFPEYEPKEGFHPYLLNMTIQDMLSMQTCHTSTTYKFHIDLNWVESFFVTAPSHRSGKLFNYDTSSSHTLAALVRKLSGCEVLDYLRTKIPSRYLFSKDAYIIKDPFGDEIGGSGLMCYPEDILKVGRFVMDELLEGADDKKELDTAFCIGDKGKDIRSFRDYIRQAVSFMTPNIQTGQVTDERQGYGYQFWRIRGGLCMYGLGGQYVLFYPQYDLVIVTTADLQNVKGGNQPLLDIIHDALLKHAPLFGEYENSIDKALCAEPFKSEFDYTYKIQENCGGFSEFHVSYNDQNEVAGARGCLNIKQETDKGVTDYTILFDPDNAAEGKLTLVDPHTMECPSITSCEVPYVSRAKWTRTDTLYIEICLVGEDVGSIHITLNISEENLSVQMRKIVEARFEDFKGFLEGTAIKK